MSEKEEIEFSTALKAAIKLVVEITPTERRSFDDIEMVFIDVVNGRPRFDRAFTFVDVIECLSRGAKPIGLILLHWDGADKMKTLELPNLTTTEQELLMHAFAEAQDEAKENIGDGD